MGISRPALILTRRSRRPGYRYCLRGGVRRGVCTGNGSDCDRVGTAIQENGEFRLITGNQMGVLLLDFICRQKFAQGTMPEHPVAVKTIVTTKLCERVAEHYGVELRNVLTGFKYIGEQIRGLEELGQTDRFLLGYEESYGYLTCPQVLRQGRRQRFAAHL